MRFRIEDTFKHKVLQNRKNLLILGDKTMKGTLNSRGEILKKVLAKTNWRIFKVSEGSSEEENLQYDALMAPEDIAFLIIKKTENLEVKFDAIITLTENRQSAESMF